MAVVAPATAVFGWAIRWSRSAARMLPASCGALRSASVIVCQARGAGADQVCSNVVLPNPAPATTQVTRRVSAWSRARSRRGLATAAVLVDVAAIG